MLTNQKKQTQMKILFPDSEIDEIRNQHQYLSKEKQIVRRKRLAKIICQIHYCRRRIGLVALRSSHRRRRLH